MDVVPFGGSIPSSGLPARAPGPVERSLHWGGSCWIRGKLPVPLLQPAAETEVMPAQRDLCKPQDTWEEVRTPNGPSAEGLPSLPSAGGASAGIQPSFTGTPRFLLYKARPSLAHMGPHHVPAFSPLGAVAAQTWASKLWVSQKLRVPPTGSTGQLTLCGQNGGLEPLGTVRPTGPQRMHPQKTLCLPHFGTSHGKRPLL
ncbi:hypothetical protein P7K49_037017 [Saguinus oedipus]|uniref:Uncharacterized protein n=1 Tax=Saguinus oedipus TaxID=9490 RepID=A0ABQ9TNC8_SAGOE|nr:hypothetical protein P7K49_037017 [Saguinus oedipus]